MNESNSNLKAPVAFDRAATLETSKFYMGSLMSFLAKGEETGGRVAMMEFQAKPGNEPPPHIHLWEHELYYVLEGSIEFYCEDKVLTAGPGESVFLPMGKPHAFYIRSQSVKTLILIQATGEHAVGLDKYFLQMAAPAESMSLPEGQITYLMADPAHVIQVGAENGIIILSPEETATALPHYPGFGVTREFVS